MSYNVETVNNTVASNTKLTDLSELTSLTPSASDYLSYNGTNWTLSSGDIPIEEPGIGHRQVGGAFGVGYPTNIYNPSSNFNFITVYHGGTASTTTASSGYSICYSYGSAATTITASQGAYITAGTYIVKYVLLTESINTSAECVFRFCVGSFGSPTLPSLANTSLVGPKFYHSPQTGMFCTLPSYIITVSTTSFIGLRCVSSTDMHISLPTQSYNYQYTLHYEKIA